MAMFAPLALGAVEAGAGTAAAAGAAEGVAGAAGAAGAAEGAGGSGLLGRVGSSLLSGLQFGGGGSKGHAQPSGGEDAPASAEGWSRS
jgi:hypothetical protein